MARPSSPSSKIRTATRSNSYNAIRDKQPADRARLAARLLSRTSFGRLAAGALCHELRQPNIGFDRHILGTQTRIDTQRGQLGLMRICGQSIAQSLAPL